MHLGQSTESRINGGWQQDSTVARLQFASLRKQLLDAQPTLNAHELVILDLGDDVDNDNMRVSQHRMVDQLVVQQTAEYGRLLAELVQDALSVYPTVRVERVPGNHGRTTQKSSYGGLAELDPIDSFDWLAGEFAREILRGDIAKGLVSLVNHDKWYGITEVQGHRVLFEHGASVKAPYSYLSPLAAVERTAHAYRELFGEFKLYCLGHFHKSYVIPFGYNGLICGNGSFPPPSPFVVTNLHQATEPVQLLLTVTPSAVEEVRRLTLPVQRSAA